MMGVKGFFNKAAAIWLLRQTAPFLPRLSVIVALNSISTFAVIYLTVITKNLIDSAAALAEYMPARDGAGIGYILAQIPEVLESRPDILRNMLFYILIILTNIALSLVSSLLAVYLNERFEFHIRRELFDKIIKSKWKEITAYHSEDLVVRLTSDVRSVASGMVNVITNIVVLSVSFTASFITLMYFDPSLAVFAFALGPVAVVLSFYSGRMIKRYQTKIQESETEYRAHMRESISNITVVKSFTAEEAMNDKLNLLYNQRMRLIIKRNRISIFMGSIIGFTYSIGYFAALLWGVVKISLNMMTFGTLSVFLNLVGRVQSPILGLAQTIPTLSAVFASAERIIEAEAMNAEDYGKANIPAVSMGITFKNVSYSYGHTDVFKNLNLTLTGGKLTALTGTSGAGKTTLIRLIMNYLDAQEGSVTFDYTDADGNKKELPASPALRGYISYVPQGNTLFSGTVRDNLLLGDPGLSTDDICAILKAVTLYDYISALPDGIDTVIGENGYGLSEGQAERVAIARALVKKSPVVIFDEATSALDEKTELEIIKNIKELENGPTCIFITHKLGILPFMDEEIKMENV
jgi:ABC-type multidrug transport system fused ATPase/permease subunit